MSEDKTNFKKLVLQKRDEGMVVYLTHEGAESVPLQQFIQQPVDGILYDLNRLEEIVLTFIDDTKWVNDFAVALTIRALYAEKAALEAKLEAMERVLFKADVAFGFIDLSNSACVDMYMRRSYEDYKREAQIAAQEEQGEGE